MTDEKFDEKEREKREEKAPAEKWRRDPLSAIVWAAIFIWAGLVFLANNLGYLDWFTRRAVEGGLTFLGGAQVWALIFLGAGVIVFVEVIIRLLVPAYRQPVTGTLIIAFILLGIGLGNMTNWNLVWPLILIAIGLSFVVRGLLRR